MQNFRNVKWLKIMRQYSVLLLALMSISVLGPQAYAKAKSQVQSSEQQVFINYASAEELALYLPGIGAKKSQTIIEHRNAHGFYASKQDLLKVKGLGSKSIEKFAMLLDFKVPQTAKQKSKKQLKK